ncbi:Bor family protein [Salmonella enterica subsp. enterica serovar Newport]|uniref:Lipoprotein bor n=1 Tax=Salmonella enterica TaxID=28901 RepID=A0A3I8FUX8_SALER|nr:lipoprotein bor [Salmonella enterica subsp. enterica serovar Napoli]EAA3705959.1 lipoprotein bor [Salmonella enterica subsp. enterica serovar Newport]EAB6471614.1 lipoprotein bor [Salmonella enterica subsp. enterica]EAP1717184.1 lipoprotein bor [Salmonella enterica]EBU9233074.1 lipoprotein bor [Salmonella enterica subsp. enterica serovar Ndolo]EBX9481589.1 lipoprotein bor [Salmonella enterica subsp. enterica serovar Abony]EEE1923542.1 lipoprotein bor [Salmonella enterica subsp. diarizonae]
MIKTASAFALVLLLSGCAQQTFKMHSAPVAPPKKVITHHFFISGLGQQKTVDAAAICGSSDKVVRTETQQTFANGLLAFVTLGIYTPLEARVYCSV